jgi:hypothetical protein
LRASSIVKRSVAVHFNVLPRSFASAVHSARGELHAVKVNNIIRRSVLDKNGNVLHDAVEVFSQKNSRVRANSIAWLGKKDMHTMYGSMVVYLTEWGETQRLLKQGFCCVGGASVSTSIFERWSRRRRCYKCYNCQQIGQKAFQCRNMQPCMRCGRQSQYHSSCHQPDAFEW